MSAHKQDQDRPHNPKIESTQTTDDGVTRFVIFSEDLGEHAWVSSQAVMEIEQ